MTTATLKKEIQEMARASVREALADELMRVRAGAVPLVSAKEQKEIEARYTKPSRKVARTFSARA